MKRRKRAGEVVPQAPDELMDASRWPRCGRYDGATQPCACWFAEEQQKWWLDGKGWPGGEAKMFADYLAMQKIHMCSRPFDWSAI